MKITKDNPLFKIGDIIEIKQKYKNGYASDITNSIGLIVEICKNNKKAKVLYPTRGNKIGLFLHLLRKVTKNA